MHQIAKYQVIINIYMRVCMYFNTQNVLQYLENNVTRQQTQCLETQSSQSVELPMKLKFSQYTRRINKSHQHLSFKENTIDQGSKSGLFKDEPWTDLTIANLKLQGPFRHASNSGQFYAILTNLRKPTDHRVPFAVVENRTIQQRTV